MKKLITTLALSLAALSAHSAFDTGEDLYNNLRSTKSETRMYALGYILSVVDLRNGEEFCVPEGTTVRDLRDIVLVTLREYPEIRPFEGALIVQLSLGKYYPCDKGDTL
jgi:hypothetical protein